MSGQAIPLQPLTRAAFAPFGQVIETRGVQPYPINRGTSARFHDLARLDLADGGGQPLVSIFRGQPFAPPVAIRMVERHPLGSQAFVPLNGQRFIVVVAPPGESADIDDLRAFVTNGHQGINYHRGVWHMPLIALEAGQEFLVIDRAGEGANCEELILSERVTLLAP